MIYVILILVKDGSKRLFMMANFSKCVQSAFSAPLFSLESQIKFSILSIN